MGKLAAITGLHSQLSNDRDQDPLARLLPAAPPPPPREHLASGDRSDRPGGRVPGACLHLVPGSCEEGRRHTSVPPRGFLEQQDALVTATLKCAYSAPNSKDPGDGDSLTLTQGVSSERTETSEEVS